MIGSYGYMAQRLNPKKILAIGWGPDVLNMPFKSLFHKMFFKKVISGIDRFVVDSNNMKKILVNFGVEKNKITVFPYGPQESFLIFPDKSTFKRPVRLVSHRKLEKEYGPFTILDALKELWKEGIEVYFTFASFGSLESDIRRRIREYNLVGKVALTGYLEERDLIDTLLAHDFYISASFYDSTSVSLLEAMSVGLYPIVSDVEANLEWIKDGKNGLVFKKGDKESLKRAILKALSMTDEEFKKVILNNYKLVKKTGKFKDNVLRAIKFMS